MDKEGYANTNSGVRGAVEGTTIRCPDMKAGEERNILAEGKRNLSRCSCGCCQVCLVVPLLALVEWGDEGWVCSWWCAWRGLVTAGEFGAGGPGLSRENVVLGLEEVMHPLTNIGCTSSITPLLLSLPIFATPLSTSSSPFACSPVALSSVSPLAISES